VSFDVAAEKYGRFMGRYSEPLAASFVDVAGLSAGQRVLDVGCGPGALTAQLVDRVGADRVTAIDPSAPFLEAARSRFPDVEVLEGSAEDLPFDDDTFDAALAELVVHFMTDPVAGLREMARVTRPGGVVAACVWDMVEGTGPLATFWAAVRDLDPEVDAEANLPGVRRGHLPELAVAAGLADVTPSVLSVTVTHPTVDDWWLPYTLGVGPAGSYVARLDDAERAAVRERCADRLPPAPFDVVARAWCVRGTVR
jgi:SAM-dependent methyltransferase